MNNDFEMWDNLKGYRNHIDKQRNEINNLKNSNFSYKWMVGFAVLGIFWVAGTAAKKIEEAHDKNEKQKIEIEKLKSINDSLTKLTIKYKGR